MAVREISGRKWFKEELIERERDIQGQ